MPAGTRELRLYCQAQTCRCGAPAQVTRQEVGFMGSPRTGRYCISCLANKKPKARR